MQDGPLSPLLANILLDDFDKELERRGHPFVPGTDAQRWSADDFLVFTKTREAARYAIEARNNSALDSLCRRMFPEFRIQHIKNLTTGWTEMLVNDILVEEGGE